MIQYEDAPSPFFQAHKAFCEEKQLQLNSLSPDLSGWCNSFGFEIKSSFQRGDLSFRLKFEKHQTTQNGVIIPVDANEYAGLEITVTGFNPKPDVRIGRSGWRRLFTPGRYKALLPGPYYISSSSGVAPDLISEWLRVVKGSGMFHLALSRGKAVCELHYGVKDPMPLIAAFEKMLRRLE